MLTRVYPIRDRRVLPIAMKPRTYRTLDACDPDLEFHVVLLLARMSRDLNVMLYEPPDLWRVRGPRSLKKR